MRHMSKNIFLLTVALGTLGACTSKRINTDDGQYWQRINAAEAVYTRGPKAQQMLNRDLAHCVSEIRELTRLGAMREGTVTRKAAGVQDPDMREMRKWEDPKRDGYMLAEHSSYYDMEGCMLAYGWDRVKYVPYDVAKQGTDDYIRAHVDYGYQTRKRDAERQDRNNIDLNE